MDGPFLMFPKQVIVGGPVFLLLVTLEAHLDMFYPRDLVLSPHWLQSSAFLFERVKTFRIWHPKYVLFSFFSFSGVKPLKYKSFLNEENSAEWNIFWSLSKTEIALKQEVDDLNIHSASWQHIYVWGT